MIRPLQSTLLGESISLFRISAPVPVWLYLRTKARRGEIYMTWAPHMESTTSRSRQQPRRCGTRRGCLLWIDHAEWHHDGKLQRHHVYRGMASLYCPYLRRRQYLDHLGCDAKHADAKRWSPSWRGW